MYDVCIFTQLSFKQMIVIHFPLLILNKLLFILFLPRFFFKYQLFLFYCKNS